MAATDACGSPLARRARRDAEPRSASFKGLSGHRPQRTRGVLAPTWPERTARRRVLLGGGVELVADAVAGLDEGVPRGAGVDLLAQLADEDVDGAVAVRGAA